MNMKSEYMQNILNECVDKAYNSVFDIASITLDRALINSKLAREYLDLLNDKGDKPIPEQKFRTYFMRNGNKIFIFFVLFT